MRRPFLFTDAYRSAAAANCGARPEAPVAPMRQYILESVRSHTTWSLIMLIEKMATGGFEHNLTLGQRLFYGLERQACHILLRRPPPTVPGEQLLNLGCGPHIYEGWVNADDYAIKRRLREPRFRPNWRLDLTRSWACPDNHWDGIFTEHVLELCSYSQVAFALGECLRTLKPGAWLRISLPDLRKYVAAYQGGSGGEWFASFPDPALIISNLTQMHLHRSTWDATLMLRVLTELGFADAKEVSYRQGTDARLLKDGDEKIHQSFYVEARKRPH